jgi:hypothetical protein
LKSWKASYPKLSAPSKHNRKPDNPTCRIPPPFLPKAHTHMK